MPQQSAIILSSYLPLRNPRYIVPTESMKLPELHMPDISEVRTPLRTAAAGTALMIGGTIGGILNETVIPQITAQAERGFAKIPFVVACAENMVGFGAAYAGLSAYFFIKLATVLGFPPRRPDW